MLNYAPHPEYSATRPDEQRAHLHVPHAIQHIFHTHVRHVTTGQRNENKVRLDFHVPWFHDLKDATSAAPIFHVEDPCEGLMHPVTPEQIRDRIGDLPSDLQALIRTKIHHVCLPSIGGKQVNGCFGMQWGSSLYLFPVETSGIEFYTRNMPRHRRQDYARYGAQWRWYEPEKIWECHWTEKARRAYYLEDVLLHEIGHALDKNAGSHEDREACACAFAQKYGKRPKLYHGNKPPHTQRKNRRHG